MAQPRQYVRQYNFTDFQTSAPGTPLPAVQIDAELNAAKGTLDDLRTNIALVQRDDGKLANLSVHPEAFDASALALLNAAEITPRGDWLTARTYAVNDLVDYNDATYLCIVAHTSTTFLADKDAGKWSLLANAAISNTASAVDKFEGNGTTTLFTLSYNYEAGTSVLVFVNGAFLTPTADYTISDNTITFTSAPSSPAITGTDNIVVWGASIVTQAAKESAEDLLDLFEDRFLGAKSGPPLTDNDGDPLLVGAMYWSSTENRMYAWTGDAWEDVRPTVAEQANINTVSGNISEIATVAANATALAGMASSAPIVASIASDVQTVAGIAANVNTVADNALALAIALG